MNVMLGVFLGGGLGSLARFGISRLVAANWETQLPIATLSANVLSCVILGLAYGAFKEKIMADAFLKALVAVGFCGGFSTFSTFSYETFELIKTGNSLWAILNIALSVVFCVAIIWMFAKSA